MKKQDILNKLIQVTLDSSKGYRVAADNTNDEQLQTFFDDSSITREKHMRALLDEADKKEGDPSLKAELHQFWINLKAAKRTFDELPIIEECIKGEKYLLDQYKQVINAKALQGDVREMVESQLRESENRLKHLKQLKNEFEEKDDEHNRETPV